MNILVTGGAGYIGSHTCIALLKAGHQVVVADDFSNSNAKALEAIRTITGKDFKFYQVNVARFHRMEPVFTEQKIDGIIHFAGFKAVGESVENPLDYYANNLKSTITLLKLCRKYKVQQFVFSSSATVYGDGAVPFVETQDLKPATNPYGETKVMNEKILMDYAKADPDFAVILLRYFNPIGAHPSGLIGEHPRGIPNNLMPYVTQVAKGIRDQLYVFGNDYDTVDGTGVRDYIHVMDLAEGHVQAMEHIKKGWDVVNLGTGKGTSVLELVQTFEKVNDIRIPYTIAPRRPGDIAICYADTHKAKKVLDWQAQRDVKDMCKDAWHFEKSNSHANEEGTK